MAKIGKGMNWIKKFREEQCRGCKFVDEEVRKRLGPCCTYPGTVKIEGNKCLNRREGE